MIKHGIMIIRSFGGTIRKKISKWIDNNFKADRLTTAPAVFIKDPVFKNRRNQLKKLYRSPYVYNIGITGGIASGKSSFIKTVEAQHIFPFRNFLKISIGDCLTVKQEMTQEQVEQYIVGQVFSHVHSSDLPYLKNKVIRDKRQMPIRLITFTFINIALLMLLCGYNKLQALIQKPYFEMFRGYLFLIFIVSVCLNLFLAIIYFLKYSPTISFTSAKFKTEHTEIEMNCSAANILDKSKTDIIYILKNMRRQIRYTVVFEDLELLDKEICLNIFRKLKILNKELNDNILSYKFLKVYPIRKPIRFLYLYRNDLSEKIGREKFFDEIISIPDRLTVDNVFDVLKDKLKKEVLMGHYEKLDIETELFPFDSNYILHTAKHLTNMRILNTIIKCYLSEWSDFINHLGEKNPVQEDAKQLFSFVVYKYFFPEDSQCFKNRTGMALNYCLQDVISKIDEDKRLLFTYLVMECPEEYRVSESCLRFINFNP